VTSPAPQSRASLCALLGAEFPVLDAATVQRAVDHGMQVAQDLTGEPEDQVWARAGTFARDHLDAAAHRVARIAGLRRDAPLAI
jgi:hypothetical protein